MKKHEIFFSMIKIPSDFILMFISFFIARKIRVWSDFPGYFNLETHTIPTSTLTSFALLWSLVYVWLFILHKLYSFKITTSKVKETLDIILYWFYWLIFYSVILYFSKWFLYNFEIPRLIVLFTFLIWTFLVIFWRIILNKVQNILLSKNIIPKSNLLLINNKPIDDIQYIIDDINQSNTYNIVWYINKSSTTSNDIMYLWKSFNKLLKTTKIDEIIYLDSDYTSSELYNIWDISRIKWIRYRYITNSFDVTKVNTEIWLINKIPVIEIKNTALDAWWRVLKRFFDIVWSLIWIILTSPVLIIVALLIKIDDPEAPIIFKNLRVWQKESFFFLYKFRYMKWKYCIKECYWIDKEEDEAYLYEQELIKTQSTRTWPLYKIKDDPRKTHIWNFIEKYSIDELPQLFNVFLGNMSLIWPRPHQPREVEKYETYQKRVLNIKPWITGLAQVNWREKNTFEDEVKLDIFYMENWSLLIDFKILVKTIWVVLKRK